MPRSVSPLAPRDHPPPTAEVTGHTGGSLHVANVLRGFDVKAKICETVTLTYICRAVSPGAVEIYRRTSNLRFAAFPGKATEGVGRLVVVARSHSCCPPDQCTPQQSACASAGGCGDSAGSSDSAS